MNLLEVSRMVKTVRYKKGWAFSAREERSFAGFGFPDIFVCIDAVCSDDEERLFKLSKKLRVPPDLDEDTLAKMLLFTVQDMEIGISEKSFTVARS